MRLKIPSMPHLVHIETTYACNQRCLFCYNPKKDTKINQEVINKIVKSVYSSWIPHVYLIGGEPSLLGSKKLNEYTDLLSERSSVTIVTNGQICLEGLSNKLACIGVPIHGLEKAHDFLANKKGSFKRALKSIENYVSQGFDVRCIPVLTKKNYNQMYKVIRLARELGMESVFIDRYEDGGVGSFRSEELKPSLDQFKIALGQMIKARDDFSIPTGWGTAIPYCLDERLLRENMTANCGAGITFAAINPQGEVRICNQSERVYGNVLTRPIEEIWHDPKFSEFRDLKWVSEPCKFCRILANCMCGCKVDASCSDKFCVDYAIRGQKSNPCAVGKKTSNDLRIEIPQQFRYFKPNKYLRLNTFHKEAYLVTRYQTISIDKMSVIMLKQIIEGVDSEDMLIQLNSAKTEVSEIRRFVSLLACAGAIDIVGKERMT